MTALQTVYVNGRLRTVLDEIGQMNGELSIHSVSVLYSMPVMYSA